MSLNKKTMVREIGRRTRLSNRDVERVIETLVEVWTEELVKGGRIELENFFVLKTIEIDRGENLGLWKSQKAPQYIQRIAVRWSRHIRSTLQEKLRVNYGNKSS